MNHLPDVEPVLRAYLADTGDRAPDRVLEDVAARIARQPRPAWRLRGRPFMNTQLKLAAGLAAAVVIAVVAWQLLPGSGGIGGRSSPLPSPSMTPAATPAVTPVATGPLVLPPGRLPGGSYRIGPFPESPTLSIVADVPAEWIGFPDLPALTGPATEEPPSGILIGFMTSEGLFGDPCHWDVDGTGSVDQPGDVKVGPSVEDLVAALKANTSYTSSTPSAITLGGYEGQRLQLQLPGDEVLSTCDAAQGEATPLYFVFPKGYYAQGGNSRWDLSIVDVDGIRLITMISSFPGTPEALVAAARDTVDSFVITP